MADPMATRDAYGAALVRMGEQYSNVVVLDADLAKSTKTIAFAKKFPDRFFDLGISEQDMVATAAGLATCGKIVFASTFAIFGSRAWEQIRNTIARANLPVILAFTHAGVSVGEDGASAQANEDMAIFRAIPNMRLVNPADGPETEAAIEYFVTHQDGPYYIRLGRAKCPAVNPQPYTFELGKAVRLRDGSDVTLIATGIMVTPALEAADLLKAEGVSARVVNMATIKPIDVDEIVAAANDTGAIVTAEEHSVIGGLGSAVAEAASENVGVPVRRVGMPDIFGESASGQEMLEKYGFTAANIAAQARKAIEIKNRS